MHILPKNLPYIEVAEPWNSVGYQIVMKTTQTPWLRESILAARLDSHFALRGGQEYILKFSV
jgi:hypothetical protein